MNTTRKFMKLFVTCTFISTMLLLGLTGKAQRLILTGSSGVSNYHGDLSNGSNPAFKPDLSLGAAYELSNRFRLRLNLSALSVQGDDATSKYAYIRERNLNFKSNIEEVAVLGEYDIVDNSFSNIIPYIFLGPSYYHFDPMALRTPAGTSSVDLHYLGTEGQYLPGGKYADRQYSRNQINIQFGAGFRVELSEKVSIGVEASFRKLFTDYLDDVSANSYITPAEWKAGIATATANNNKDLEYRLTEDEKYYSWRYIDAKGNALVQTSQNSSYPRGDPAKDDDYYSFQVRLNIRLFGESSGFYTPSNPNGRRQLRCARVY